MTETLREALRERAELSRPADLDLDLLVRRADRQVRRRRFAGAVAVSGSPNGGRQPDGPQVANGSGGGLFSYAVGSTIVSGGRTIEVGRDVASFVPVVDGVVYADDDDALRWSDGRDTATVGTVAAYAGWHPQVTVDDPGRTVAWLERTSGDFDLAVLPVRGRPAEGSVVRVPVPDVAAGAHPDVVAIDGGTVYVTTGTQVLAFSDVADGRAQTPQVVDRNVADGEIVDVADGHFLRQLRPDDARVGLTVSTTPTGRGAVVHELNRGDLSPDAKHWFTEDYDQFSVYDSATGRRLDPRHPGFAFAAPYAWLDDDTMAVLGLETPDDDASISLLRCRISTADCMVEVRDIGHYGDVALPIGKVLGE
jgi:hypothetical protein